jgi:acetyl-CoA carboxylase biotin carboxyl carrier protein
MSPAAIPLLATTDAQEGAVLRAPKLGVWSDPPRAGAFVEPGSSAGTLTQLGKRFPLIVPDGVSGRVAIESRRHDALPVEYGEVLFRVSAIAFGRTQASSGESKSAQAVPGALAIVSPTDGVFYRAGALGAKPYVVVGERLAAGRPVGLIEVMKTFNPIAYGGPGFPDEAEVVEILAADGQEVRAGQALVRVKRL